MKSVFCRNQSIINCEATTASKYMRFIPGNICNFNCYYCHKEGNDINNSVYSDKYYITDYKTEHLFVGFEKVRIVGGEPLCYHSIFDWLQSALNYCRDVGITTNGSLLLSRIDSISSLPPQINFNISLNSVYRTTFKKITGKDELKNVLDGLELLIKMGYPCKLNTVITHENINELDSILEFVSKHGLVIKLLDLISEDKSKIINTENIYNILSKSFDIKKVDFSYGETNYIVENAKVRLQNRLYGKRCFKCSKYPCGEGLFCVRIFGDEKVKTCIESPDYRGMATNVLDAIKLARENLINECDGGVIIVSP